MLPCCTLRQECTFRCRSVFLSSWRRRKRRWSRRNHLPRFLPSQWRRQKYSDAGTQQGHRYFDWGFSWVQSRRATCGGGGLSLLTLKLCTHCRLIESNLLTGDKLLVAGNLLKVCSTTFGNLLMVRETNCRSVARVDELLHVAARCWTIINIHE